MRHPRPWLRVGRCRERLVRDWPRRIHLLACQSCDILALVLRAAPYLHNGRKRPALAGEESHDAVVRVNRQVAGLGVEPALVGEHALVRGVRHGLRVGAEALHVFAIRFSGDRAGALGAAALLGTGEPRVRRRGLEDGLQFGAGGDEADCPQQEGHEAELTEGPHRGGFCWGGDGRGGEVEKSSWGPTSRAAADRAFILVQVFGSDVWFRRKAPACLWVTSGGCTKTFLGL